jgi:hypothetical protein
VYHKSNFVAIQKKIRWHVHPLFFIMSTPIHFVTQLFHSPSHLIPQSSTFSKHLKIFQSVLLEWIVKISLFTFTIYHLPHNDKYQLNHLFFVSWIHDKMMVITCNRGAQTKGFHNHLWGFFSFHTTSPSVDYSQIHILHLGQSNSFAPPQRTLHDLTCHS